MGRPDGDATPSPRLIPRRTRSSQTQSRRRSAFLLEADVCDARCVADSRPGPRRCSRMLMPRICGALARKQPVNVSIERAALRSYRLPERASAPALCPSSRERVSPLRLLALFSSRSTKPGGAIGPVLSFGSLVAPRWLCASTLRIAIAYAHQAACRSALFARRFGPQLKPKSLADGSRQRHEKRRHPWPWGRTAQRVPHHPHGGDRGPLQ